MLLFWWPCYCFYDLIKVKDFDFDNALIDKISYDILVIFCFITFNGKLSFVQNLCVLICDKVNRFIRV